MNSAGWLNHSERQPLRPPRVPVAPAYSQLQRASTRVVPSSNSDALRHRRAAGVLLVIFCLGVAIGLVHVIGISHQVLARLEANEPRDPSLMRQPHTQSRDVVGSAWKHVREDERANVLVVYSDGPHLSKLAAAVETGASNVLGDESKSLRVRTLDNASFADVMWADAVILGTHVVNANVEPKVRWGGCS